MKAIVQDSYGSADVLRVREVDPPQIAASEVLVHEGGAGVDRGCPAPHEGPDVPGPPRRSGLPAPKTSSQASNEK